MKKTVILITIQNSIFVKLILIFSLVRTAFFNAFVLLYEMVDSEYITDNYKIFKKINIGAIIKKKTELKILVPDHLKTKKMCKDVIKKLTFLIRYVSDEYKTQQMYNKAVVENGGILQIVPDNLKVKNCVVKLFIMM